MFSQTLVANPKQGSKIYAESRENSDIVAANGEIYRERVQNVEPWSICGKKIHGKKIHLLSSTLNDEFCKARQTRCLSHS